MLNIGGGEDEAVTSHVLVKEKELNTHCIEMVVYHTEMQ
jgi:hypothetical protein